MVCVFPFFPSLTRQRVVPMTTLSEVVSLVLWQDVAKPLTFFTMLLCSWPGLQRFAFPASTLTCQISA